MNRFSSLVVPWLAVMTCSASSMALADEVSVVSQLVRAGQSTEAMAKLDQFLAIKPKDPQLRFLKGVLLADGKQTEAAIATFTQLNQDYPELPEPYNNLAVLYAGQGQYDKARVALEAAIRGNPGYATAYENLGDVYARLAAQAYSRALALDSSNASLPPKMAQLRALFVVKSAEAGSAAASGSGGKTK